MVRYRTAYSASSQSYPLGRTYVSGPYFDADDVDVDTGSSRRTAAISMATFEDAADIASRSRRSDQALMKSINEKLPEPPHRRVYASSTVTTPHPRALRPVVGPAEPRTRGASARLLEAEVDTYLETGSAPVDELPTSGIHYHHSGYDTAGIRSHLNRYPEFQWGYAAAANQATRIPKRHRRALSLPPEGAPVLGSQTNYTQYGRYGYPTVGRTTAESIKRKLDRYDDEDESPIAPPVSFSSLRSRLLVAADMNDASKRLYERYIPGVDDVSLPRYKAREAAFYSKV